MQTRLSAAMPSKVLARVKRNVEILTQAAQLLSVPVIVTEQYPEGLGPVEPDIAKHLPNDALRFEKTRFSCCGAEGFTQSVADSKRRQAILTGMEAHVCVLQTAIDLHTSGLEVFVVADAVCSRKREDYENALLRMQQAGIMLVNTESVVFEWLRDARHEHFKTISALIR
ncbi:MAG: isochorismatase family protein [Gammaproteobacteria bacterium]|nr:isochorismatase family protein [Gammaproteobacteria bacterium]MCI0591612.1 isochorismatase family protein [Gammaproteobacteria bacterium]